MAQVAIKIKLETLLDLLQQEREMVQTFDMEGLELVVAAKEELISTLNPQVVGLEPLLKQIDDENRRNAFLLWTGLNWVRDMMGFFGKVTVPQVYSGGGQARSLNESGRLLSGQA